MTADDPAGVTGDRPAGGTGGDSDPAAAEPLAQLKDDFLRLVSHELRTPLTGIRGYSELLISDRAGPLNETQRRMLTMIDFCAHRLHNLVEDLLLLSSIDSGMFGLALEPVDLGRTALRAVDLVAARSGAAGVTFTDDIAAGVPTVLADPRQVERMVIDLLNNAVRFSPRGGTVVVAVRAVAGGVQLTVADQGTGIPQEDQEQLFERFFRGPEARERDLQGSGLGLAVVKAVVDHHGGEVTVASNADAGTSVRVVLPTSAAPPPAPHRMVDRNRRRASRTGRAGGQ